MESRRLPAKSLVLITLLFAIAALCMLPTFVTAAGSKGQQAAYNKAVLHVTIAMTSKGIVATPNSLKPGNHLLTIRNNTSKPRAIEMIGIDRESSPTIRYTKVLKPWTSESFRWYFAKGKTVYVRDVMSCTHGQNNCMMVTFGQMRKAIDVK